MSVPSCPTCDLLSERVVDTTTRYIKLSGSLELAKMDHDTERISELEPRLERAKIERERAVEEFSRHKDAHADAANG